MQRQANFYFEYIKKYVYPEGKYQYLTLLKINEYFKE